MIFVYVVLYFLEVRRDVFPQMWYTVDLQWYKAASVCPPPHPLYHWLRGPFSR